MAGLCTFSLARFDRSRVPSLLAAVPLERLRLQRTTGLAWGRHLGTSDGSRTLGADLARWAWFCSWDDDEAASRFHARLDARLRPAELATLTLRTLRARGRWGGNEVPSPDPGASGSRPTGAVEDDPLRPATAAPSAQATPGEAGHDPRRPATAAPSIGASPARADGDGPLVVLTRARVRPTRWRPFTDAIPPVDADLGAADGRLRSLGVGEWPVLVQGTLSVWRDSRAMAAFSRTEAHRTAVRRTADEAWYAEELFARFAVVAAEGVWDGTPALGDRREEDR